MLEKRKGECEGGSERVSRNREGESGREMRDVASQMGERRLREEGSFSARLFREREMSEKIGARRKWTKEDDIKH